MRLGEHSTTTRGSASIRPDVNPIGRQTDADLIKAMTRIRSRKARIKAPALTIMTSLITSGFSKSSRRTKHLPNSYMSRTALLMPSGIRKVA
jgi:hypothetical protein